jgi:hypothetical protein
MTIVQSDKPATVKEPHFQPGRVIQSSCKRNLTMRIFIAVLILFSFVRVADCQTPAASTMEEQTDSSIPAHDSVVGERRPTVVPAGDVVGNPHVIRYTRLPTQWAEGLPLGNGEIGVMCWSDGRQLRFTLDSASAWDLRHKSGEPDYSQLSYSKLREWVADGDYDAIQAAAGRIGERDRLRPTKLYLGRFDLEVEFEAESELSLCLADASVRGVLRRGATTHNLHAFVNRTQDLFCLQLDPWPEGARLKLRPFDEVSPGLAALGHPQLEISHEGGLTVAIQQILPDTFFAVCWNRDGPEVYVSVAKAKNAAAACQQALAHHPGHRPNAYRELFADHQQAWEDFWSVSSVSLPERDLEFLWYFGVYALASSARIGSNPPGLQGLWAMDGRVPPWRGDYHTDMNVQETFWPALPSGHLDLMDVWLDFAGETLPAAERITREVYGTDGAFQLVNLFPEYTGLPGAGPVSFAWSHTGWLAHLAWLRWRYSMDTDWLERRGYPIVRSAFLFYSSNLVKEDDGRYHVPLSSSPEYGGSTLTAWCKDPNIDIALIRRCCDWICEMEQALNIDKLSGRAREIHEKLVPYHLATFDHPAYYVRDGAPAGKCVLTLWKDKLLDYSHRHPSHLMAIHPAMDITVEGGEAERKIIQATVGQYLTLGQYGWAGHTYVQMVCLAAAIGEPEMAYNFLRCYRDRWVFPNGLHFNREIGRQGNSHFFLADRESFSDKAPFTINETCGISCGISDMLVQGWGDCLRLFPATPARWQDVLFVDLRTEGAFRVSALRRAGQVPWVRITAEVDGLCRLRNPFDDRPFEASGCVPKTEKGLLIWPMTARQTVSLSLPEFETPDLAQESGIIRVQRGP